MKDKIMHGVVSASIVFVVWYVFRSLELAVILSLFVGIGKEIYDEKYGTGFSMYDLLADVMGIIFAVVVVGGW